MSNGIIALIAVGSAVVYFVGAGVMYAVAKHRGWDFNSSDPGPQAAVMFWPLVLPAVLAATITTRLLTLRTKLPRAEVRRG